MDFQRLAAVKKWLLLFLEPRSSWLLVATAVGRCIFQFAFASASQIRFWHLSTGCQRLMRVNGGSECVCVLAKAFDVHLLLIVRGEIGNKNLELYTSCCDFRSQILSISLFLLRCYNLSLCMQNVPSEYVILQAKMRSV